MKRLALPLLMLSAGIMLFMTVNTVLQQEGLIEGGHIYRFKTRPMDPKDPFRGSYVRLRFEASTFLTSSPELFKKDATVYALLDADSTGFAQITQLVREPPRYNNDFVEVRVRSVGKDRVFVQFPFDRYYMPDEKAQAAEDLIRQRSGDREPVYAVVYVKGGKATLQELRQGDASLTRMFEDLD